MIGINNKISDVGEHRLTFRMEPETVLGKCTCGWWYRRSNKLKRPDQVIKGAWRKAHYPTEKAT